MAFDPADGLRNTTFAPTDPANESEIRDTIQDIPDQLRDYINNTIIPAVEALPTNDTVLTKTNTTAYTPTTSYHPATKKYVDDTTAGVVLGQIPDGSLTDIKLSNASTEIKQRFKDHEILFWMGV